MVVCEAPGVDRGPRAVWRPLAPRARVAGSVGPGGRTPARAGSGGPSQRGAASAQGEVQAASGRYCRQVAGIVGDANWMKMCAPGVRGFTRGCMLTWCGSRSALRRLQGAQEATMLSQPEPPPLERGITWSTVSDVRAPQYWHCQPSRANTARRGILRLWVARGRRTEVT